MPHYPAHFYMGVAALAATLLVWGLTVNRLVKRKLQLSILPSRRLHRCPSPVPGPARARRREHDLTSPTRPFERLALTAALVNLLVISLINPLGADRVRDRFRQSFRTRS